MVFHLSRNWIFFSKRRRFNRSWDTSLYPAYWLIDGNLTGSKTWKTEINLSEIDLILAWQNIPQLIERSTNSTLFNHSQSNRERKQNISSNWRKICLLLLSILYVFNSVFKHLGKMSGHFRHSKKWSHRFFAFLFPPSNTMGYNRKYDACAKIVANEVAKIPKWFLRNALASKIHSLESMRSWSYIVDIKSETVDLCC